MIQTLLFILMLTLVGCGARPKQTVGNENQNTTPPMEELFPKSPNVVYAVEKDDRPVWTELSVIAYSARTTLDIAAHFSTSRNACGKSAYGVMDLESWNKIASLINIVATSEPAEKDYCVPPGDVFPFMDDTTEINIFGKNRLLYKYDGSEICSRIQDHEVSDALLAEINKLIKRSDREECGN